jgi:apolipoprotein N-acyltransferase
MTMLSARVRGHAGLVSFLLGAGLSLAFAPFGIFPLAFLAPAGLVWLWEGASPRRSAWLGFCFGSGTFLAGTYWLYTSIHVFGKAPVWVAFVLMLGLVAIMGLYHALAGYFVARFLPAAGLWRWIVGIPAVWILVEWLRGWVLSGFPWLALGYSQIDSWLAALAPVGGVYFVSFLVMLTAGALVAVLRGSALQRIAAAALVIVVWTAGALLSPREWTRQADGELTVSLVQGAISQDLKWQEENREATLRLYDRMTRDVFGSELIVWPEAALPVLEHEVSDYLAQLNRDARAHGSQVVMGILRYDFERQQFRNGLLVLDESPQWYYKRRLVPFGEFFPVPAFVRNWMRLMTLPYVDFAAGDRDQPALRAAGVRLAPTICYEDAYASEQLDVLREATVLINVSNDAWFGDSTAPHQHLEIARMRALEAGRYLLRATNNGVTAIIGPDGSIVSSIPQFKPAVLQGKVSPRTGLTPYAVVGNVPVVLLCLLLLVIATAVAMSARRRVRTEASMPAQSAVMQRGAGSKG